MSPRAPAPDLAVIVIALAGGRALEACVERLASESTDCHVMLGDGMEAAATWRARFPGVHFSEGSDLTVPARRQRALASSKAAGVALLEDTSLPAPGWLHAVAEGLATDDVGAVGGPVVLDAALSARGLALGCTEYGRFHPRLVRHIALGAPDARGLQAVSRLPGNNLAYRRAPTLDILSGHQHGLLEAEVNEALQARGLRLVLHPGATVSYVAADPRGQRLGVRFDHGRLYGASRAAHWGLPRRLAWSAGSLFLPLLLSARALSAMLRAVPSARWLATAWWIVLMECSWAAGEAAGYLAGGGKSMASWR